jgi:hypothetical protein
MPIMKPVREDKARSRAVVPLKKKKKTLSCILCTKCIILPNKGKAVCCLSLRIFHLRRTLYQNVIFFSNFFCFVFVFLTNKRSKFHCREYSQLLMRASLAGDCSTVRMIPTCNVNRPHHLSVSCCPISRMSSLGPPIKCGLQIPCILVAVLSEFYSHHLCTSRQKRDRWMDRPTTCTTKSPFLSKQS